MATRRPLSITNRYRHFVFITATAENSASHKYIIIKGSKTFIALTNFGSRFSQAAKTEEHVFQGTRHRICL
jgi:hypothetical protein